MADADLVRERKRRGHWMRIAREAAEVKQDDAAHALGGEPMTNELLVTFWGDAARILRASPPP